MPTIETIVRHNKTQLIITFPDGTFYEFYSLGASLLSWKPQGKQNIVARYLDIEEIQNGGLYLSTTIGPIAGRIANGQFVLNEQVIQLHKSNRPYLHSGSHGFHTLSFDTTVTKTKTDEVEVVFSKTTQHETIPGLLDIKIRYRLSNNQIRLSFEVTSNQDTIVNLTNHSYFSLIGEFKDDLYVHDLQINADRVLLIDQDMIPNEIIPVDGTLFDFRNRRSLKHVLTDPSWQTQTCRGIDHYFFLNQEKDVALRLYSQSSPLYLEIKTSYPGVTLYSTNYPTKQPLESNQIMGLHGAIAIEPQFPPNGINHPSLYPSILRKGEVYQQYIEYILKEQTSS